MTKAIEAAEGAFLRVFDTDRPAALLHLNEALRQAIIAYLAAMKAEGFVMVPVEPTEAMRRAGATADNDAQASPFWIPPEQSSLMVYAAMIAASTQHDDGGE